MKDSQIVVPKGTLRFLKIGDIKPSINNPRFLFDPEPLTDLRNSISEHGVLVPITVYELKGQQGKYGILDGERRYRCCLDLQNQGKDIDIPANIVEPPTKIAALIYMFSIHNFREQWELMPTALGLKEVMDELKESDTKKLALATGLSPVQVERCKILLKLPKEFQKLSLAPKTEDRIPSNFWIEADPIIEVYQKYAPKVISELGRKELLKIFIEKYRQKKIKSVIHFRRIQEVAERVAENEINEKSFSKALTDYAEQIQLETREVFDLFLPQRDVRTVLAACDDFIEKLKKLNLQFATEDRTSLRSSLKKTQDFISKLLTKMEGEDPPERRGK